MKKIKLLVLPSLFPEYIGDVKGIFILDYLESVKKYCEITVFKFYFTGTKKGLTQDIEGDFHIFRYYFSDKKKLSKIRKIYYYLKFFLIAERLVLKSVKDIDIIHSHGSVFYGNLALSLSKKLLKPYIITEHTNPFSKISSKLILKFLSKRSIQKCDGLLCVSNHILTEILEAEIKAGKMHITFNPVDTNTFKLMYKEKKNDLNMVFVGNLNERKGALRSLYAFNKIHLKYPELKFSIIGEGEDRSRIEKFIKENRNIKDKIKLYNYLTKKEINKKFFKMDFLIFPTESESFGLVIAEAMSCGLPVIVGNKTAPPEFVDNESGILVDPNNIDEIAGAIEFMIKNHHKYNRELIRKKIVDRFSFKEFGDRLIKIYRELL